MATKIYELLSVLPTDLQQSLLQYEEFIASLEQIILRITSLEQMILTKDNVNS